MRPKLLFLCQTLPFPPDGGVNIRSYNVLRLLSRDFDVVMLCFYRAQDRTTAEAVRNGAEGLKSLARIEVFPIPQEHSRIRLIADHTRSLLGSEAYTRWAYESNEFRERLDHYLRAERFDLAHVDSMDLVAYLPALKALPIVCVHHNVESALLRRRANAEENRLKRAYLSRQADLLEKTERRWCGRVALNVAVSPNDAADLARIAPEGRYTVVPNGVDPDFFRPGATDRREGLVFVGGANWFPNRDALGFFGADILPLIRARGLNPSVKWIGRASDALRQTYAEQHIELTGYMEDVRPTVQESACYVAPLRVGGGTRLKILDAWAMGKAIVSTSIGCEGLDARDGENILIRDTAAGFADAVTMVLNDPALRTRLERGARETVESTYSWEIIGRGMKDSYFAVMESFAGKRPPGRDRADRSSPVLPAGRM